MYWRDFEGEENIKNETRECVDFRMKDIGKEIKERMEENWKKCKSLTKERNGKSPIDCRMWSDHE